MKVKEKTLQQLKEFGEVMTIAMLVFAAISIWKHHDLALTALLLLSAALVFFLFGIFAPERLRRFEKVWMAFGDKLGTIMTYVVMLLTFTVIVTPIGLLVRLLGKDLLSMKLDPKRTTYWEPVDPQGPGSRPFLPY